MTVYSIKDLEKLSGIKAHTIRIWEQRYNILTPHRTKTNIRYYHESDLKILLNISLLNKNGVKISKIAKMSSEEISHRVAEVSNVQFQDSTQVDILTLAMMDLDEFKFDSIITTSIKQLGFEGMIRNVIYPFLDKLGLLWLTGTINPIQEHFISNLIRQKIIAAINDLPFPTAKEAKRFFVYLPEGEGQELSILLVHYFLKIRGHKVFYFGTNISLEDVRDAYQIQKADYIYTMITESYTEQPVQHYVDQLVSAFPDTKFLLSGYQVVVQDVEITENTTILKSFDETVDFLETL